MTDGGRAARGTTRGARHFFVSAGLVASVLLVACAQGGGVDSVDAGTAGELDAGFEGRDAGGPVLPDAGHDAGVDGGPIGPQHCTTANAREVCGAKPCVDGYCCDQTCTGACRGCALPGAEGTCTIYARDTDPDDECAMADPSTCGTTGACNGAGACAYYASSVTCDDRQACTSSDTCDGSGVCRGAAPVECTPGAGNECCIGGCDASAGCRTTAGSCGDVCEANRLVTGRACQGCGAARAAGTCTGGTTYRCDETSHSLCQEITCGPMHYFCTNQGGSWQWRTATSCDDGNACTHTDRCLAGSCGGTAVTCTDSACMTRACNGTDTCTQTPRTGTACDDGDACTFGDACTAMGLCAGPSRVTCTDSPCVDRSCNGTATCAERTLTGACDDGNACTFGETCDGSGTCGNGTTVTCTGMDTTCRHFACNGTASCAASAVNVGGACDDGNAATDRDVCRADGSCMGSTGCPPPTDSCTNGSQSRDGCSNARIIGRVPASMAGGAVISSSTCSASDRFDDDSGCWDAQSDHAYRLYMRAGESASIRYDPGSSCPGSRSTTWYGTLKIFENSGCGDTSCGTKVYCRYNETDQTASYTAPRDGWIIIVADGSSAFEDHGSYTLTVRLTCSAAGCGCS